MRRFSALILCILMLTGTVTIFSGCSDPSVEPVDPDRTQLYVNNYNGGYGTQWLYDLKARFEEDFKDVPYEKDKVGVQIIINAPKTSADGMFATFLGSSDEVFFNEKVFYNDYVDAGYLLPLTDIMTESLEKYGDTGTIEGKLIKSQKDYLKVDGEYYAIPHYEGYTGLVYDVDLFESEGFYFAKTHTAEYGDFVSDGYDESLRSAGPDGDEGTYDDGLPATYEEFYKLCDKLVADGIVPVGWSGKNPHYSNLLATSLHASYEGPEQMMLNYDFTGTAKNLITVNNGTVTRQGDVNLSTVADGYKVYSQAGRYYALTFMEKLVSNQNYYSAGSFNSVKGHLDAQEDFLYGRFVPEKSRIAMHVDGIWWENEADSVFEDMAKTFGNRASKNSRKFALLPSPKAGQTGEYAGQTLYNNTEAYGFIRSTITSWKIPLAKAFLQYANTNQSLKNFIVSTNTPKALDVKFSSFTDEEKAQMTYFGKSVMQMRDECEVVYPLSQNEVFLNNQSQFTLHINMWQTQNAQQYPVTAMRAASSNKITAEAYFKDIQNRYTETYWNSLFL